MVEPPAGSLPSILCKLSGFAKPQLPEARMYSEIEPSAHGVLTVGDGNRIYWEIVGCVGALPGFPAGASA